MINFLLMVMVLMFMAQLSWYHSYKTTLLSYFLPTAPCQKSLAAYLSKEIADHNFAIHYYIGGGLGGETDFRLRGDGTYQLSSSVTKGYKQKCYSGQLTTGQVQQVVLSMLTNKVWLVKHDPSNRWVGDLGAKITVFAEDEKYEYMLWLSEIRESQPFIAVQKELLSLIAEVSGREVLENGRGTGNIFFPEPVGAPEHKSVTRGWEPIEHPIKAVKDVLTTLRIF